MKAYFAHSGFVRSRFRLAQSVAGFAAVCGLACLSLVSDAQGVATRHLGNHVPALVNEANLVGRAPQQTMPLALTLRLRNEAQLDALLARLYNPNDALYGHYLTTQQFVDDYAPTQADYNAVAAFARAQGLTVTGTSSNRLILNVEGATGVVEAAFGVSLQQYRLPEGREFRAPAGSPVVPASIASKLQSVVGLDTAGIWRAHNRVKAVDPLAFLDQGQFTVDALNPNTTGSGPGGGLTPADIKKAYNLSGVTATGTGQTLALFELDGYLTSDITKYEAQFGLPAVPLQNVLVDGATGAAGSGAGEVTLDIDLQIALAPGVTKVMVYEGPNSGAGVLDTYNRIATDNIAKSVSTSWGLAEKSNSASALQSENTIFKQMAAQGQSLFAASGDSGAYDNGSTLSVDDPASQPYVTGVGGTKLTTAGAGGAYSTETSWNGGSIANGGGGGGISTVWTLPSYQTGFGSAASKASTTMRNVPDVSLEADPNNGYIIYLKGTGYVYGGTSCAAPLWSAFAALVNQQRASAGKGTLGLANTLLYSVAAGANYAADFHDIADNSTNLYYPAVTGYDLATGLGTFNGANLLADLSGGTVVTPPPPPPTPTGSQLLGNPGFENGSVNPAPWIASAGVISNATGEATHGGTWKAWMDGYGKTHTDTLYQSVAIPASVTTATLTFYLHIDTSETTKTSAYDKLTVQVRSSSGTVLKTLAAYSNLNAATGYALQTFDLSAYKGQTVQVYLTATEDSSLQTSFVVDDFALNAQ